VGDTPADDEGEVAMQAQVKGTTMPVLEMMIDPGEILIAEGGNLSWISDAVQLKTTTQTAGAKGVMGALKRAVAGGGLFMTEYTAQGAQGMVAFATKLPGQILPMKIESGAGYMIHRGGFLCATQGVEVTVGFQRKLGAGIFGGEGFILEKIQGSCDAWIELDGEVMIYDLAPGQTLRVHPGHVGMFEDRVAFDITTVPGVKNKLFGGDGLFLAKLSGPGRVWLQSLTLPNLAHALEPYLPKPSGSEGGGVNSVMNMFGN
jgi:uncharacterized protein (TIGR00266 family)